MIRFEDVSKWYDEHLVIDRFNETIEDGEFLVITGESGVGKTTLLKMLTREEEVSEGAIYVDDEDISLIPQKDIPFYRRKMGMIFQDFRLVKELSIYDNLDLSRRIFGWGAKESETRITNVMKFLGIDRFHKRFPDELSGGEQQKVCLARAILNDPKILLADEPTRNLDPGASGEFVHLMQLINKQGTTIIMVTHDIETIKREAGSYRRIKLELADEGYEDDYE